jgi:hypothetical protein
MHVSYPVRAAGSPLDTLAPPDGRRPAETVAIHEARVNPEVHEISGQVKFLPRPKKSFSSKMGS